MQINVKDKVSIRLTKHEVACLKKAVSVCESIARMASMDDGVGPSTVLKHINGDGELDLPGLLKE